MLWRNDTPPVPRTGRVSLRQQHISEGMSEHLMLPSVLACVCVSPYLQNVEENRQIRTQTWTLIRVINWQRTNTCDYQRSMATKFLRPGLGQSSRGNYKLPLLFWRYPNSLPTQCKKASKTSSIRSAASTQYRLVTHRQTDGQTESQSIYSVTRVPIPEP